MSDNGIKNGVFLHSNGRTYTCTQLEEDYTVGEDMLEVLSGKTVEEQLEHYYVTESHRFYSTAYGDVTKDDLRRHSISLADYCELISLLFKGDILIGAVIKADSGKGFLLREYPVCTYYACDNEGSGTKEREDYAYLIFSKE